MDNKFTLTVLGTRGSMPVEGKNFAVYGGTTSCYRVLAGNEEIYLRAFFAARPRVTRSSTAF